MKRYLLSIALFITIVIYYAASIKAGGTVGFDYDLYNKSWVWSASLEKEIVKNIYVGTTLRTPCSDYGIKVFIPSWMPIQQQYTDWIEYRNNNFSLKLTDWCNHWLRQAGFPYLNSPDTQGLTLSGYYKF